MAGYLRAAILKAPQNMHTDIYRVTKYLKKNILGLQMYLLKYKYFVKQDKHIRKYLLNPITNVGERFRNTNILYN